MSDLGSDGQYDGSCCGYLLVTHIDDRRGTLQAGFECCMVRSVGNWLVLRVNFKLDMTSKSNNLKTT